MEPSLVSPLPTAPKLDSADMVAERSLGTLSALLKGLPAAAGMDPPDKPAQDQLVQARLGVAGALFTSLRAKHPETAQHCLRVAIRCSAVGRLLAMTMDELDALEVAALLHDVGKIGVPDAVLTKPGKLTDSEMELMGRHGEIGIEILESCTTDQAVLKIIRASTSRYDGRGNPPGQPVGDQIPIGARILSIADAYDAMTTHQVYRAAMSRERALAELFQHAGTQFDPHLVHEFAKLSEQTEADLGQSVTRRWSEQLRPGKVNSIYQVNSPLIPPSTDRPSAAWLFQQRLLDAMHDGVIFVDASGRIALWNRGAERLSGVSREVVLDKTWISSLIGLRDAEGNSLHGTNCPVSHVTRTGVQVFRRAMMTHARGKEVTVDLHVFPVIDEQHRCLGVTILLHDVSSEINLEERVRNLHEQATTDPLTGVLNRAEFDRLHQQMVESSLVTGTPCSILLCDIDRFKQVNDQFGHQAGDEALIHFATLLQQFSRDDDVVARYGGEEFVMLCPDCDSATATRRAEEIRLELSRTPQPMLKQGHMTASFGVTEIQLGDTTETMLRRADRGLYQAKDLGRNRVVELGAGMMQEAVPSSKRWFGWLQRPPADCLLQRRLVASVPINLLVEKIRGFMCDHEAEIIHIEENSVALSLDSSPQFQRRVSDRPFALVVELQMTEFGGPETRLHGTQTQIEVVIRPRRGRDRRRRAAEQASHVLASLKAYLIAQEMTTETR